MLRRRRSFETLRSGAGGARKESARREKVRQKKKEEKRNIQKNNDWEIYKTAKQVPEIERNKKKD